MTTSTDPITITPFDYHDAAIGADEHHEQGNNMTAPNTDIQIQLSGCTRSGPEKPQRLKLSRADCRAIVDASGLTARVEAALMHLADAIAPLADRIGLLEQVVYTDIATRVASLEKTRVETGESEPQQLRADLKDSQAEVARLTDIRVADALAGNSRATARAEKAETELENARAAWRNMDARVIARVEKAEAELGIANATIIGLQESAREMYRSNRSAEEGWGAARARIKILDDRVAEIQATCTRLLAERAVAKDAMKGAVPLTTTIKETT